MDWKVIKKKHPKAFKLVVKWNRSIDSDGYPYVEDRNLYDFFDGQEIYIGIKGQWDIDYGWVFSYCINNDKETGDYENRLDAEIAAFKECFGILERYLIDKNEKLNQFLEQFISVKKIAFIKALKYKNIALSYGTGNYPVSIGYMEENVILKKEVLDACKKISQKEWDNADKINFKFKMISINAQ